MDAAELPESSSEDAEDAGVGTDRDGDLSEPDNEKDRRAAERWARVRGLAGPDSSLSSSSDSESGFGSDGGASIEVVSPDEEVGNIGHP